VEIVLVRLLVLPPRPAAAFRSEETRVTLAYILHNYIRMYGGIAFPFNVILSDNEIEN
jgi:hypothetical protein